MIPTANASTRSAQYVFEWTSAAGQFVLWYRGKEAGRVWCEYTRHGNFWCYASDAEFLGSSGAGYETKEAAMTALEEWVQRDERLFANLKANKHDL